MFTPTTGRSRGVSRELYPIGRGEGGGLPLAVGVVVGDELRCGQGLNVGALGSWGAATEPSVTTTAAAARRRRNRRRRRAGRSAGTDASALMREATSALA
jgi:hypothetical protein